MELLENLKLDGRLESLENLKLDGRLESLENLKLDGRLESLENLQAGSRFQSLDERQIGTEKWIQLLGAQLNSVALETRVLKDDSLVAPKLVSIQNPVEFAKKIFDMQGKLKINLGSGNKLLDGYLNVDFRELPGIDLVSDISNLPFPPDSVDEIASSHLVEHFREYVFVTRLLPCWFSLLKQVG